MDGEIRYEQSKHSLVSILNIHVQYFLFEMSTNTVFAEVVGASGRMEGSSDLMWHYQYLLLTVVRTYRKITSTTLNLRGM